VAADQARADGPVAVSAGLVVVRAAAASVGAASGGSEAAGTLVAGAPAAVGNQNSAVQELPLSNQIERLDL